MTLDQLIQQFRVDADDLRTPFLWESEWLATWFTEAVAEAAIRGRLLYEAVSPAVCEIAVEPGKAVYDLHKCLYEITHLRFKRLGDSRSRSLHLISRDELDRVCPDWRDRQSSVPDYAIQSDTRIQLAFSPTATGTLHLEGYRVPLKALVNDNDKPEIGEAHHRHLTQWALYRALSKPDSDGSNPERAAAAEAAFTRYFGMRPDVNLRRVTREDFAPTSKPFWP